MKDEDPKRPAMAAAGEVPPRALAAKCTQLVASVLVPGAVLAPPAVA